MYIYTIFNRILKKKLIKFNHLSFACDRTKYWQGDLTY